VHKRFVKHRKHRLHSHRHTAVGFTLSGFYYFYLYITKVLWVLCNAMNVMGYMQH
jgi:hypothetical protein